MQTPISSKQLKAGSKFYFLDVRAAKNGNKYLQITETRKDQNGERVRNSVMVFPDHVKEFMQALTELVALI